MISYGTQLITFKREVINYIIEKIRTGAYRVKPGDLWVSLGERPVGYIKDDIRGNQRLEELSVEKLVCISDKMHFSQFDSQRVRPLVPQEQPESQTTQNQGIMSFEIKKGVPLPGFTKKEVKVVQKKNNYTNYRALPLKDLQVGDCIIVHENCTEKNISSKCSSTKAGVESLINLMDTKKKFKVAKTDNFEVGVWRIE